eukprot:411996-Prymnesium_polylepis.2
MLGCCSLRRAWARDAAVEAETTGDHTLEGRQEGMRQGRGAEQSMSGSAVAWQTLYSHAGLRRMRW